MCTGASSAGVRSVTALRAAQRSGSPGMSTMGRERFGWEWQPGKGLAGSGLALAGQPWSGMVSSGRPRHAGGSRGDDGNAAARRAGQGSLGRARSATSVASHRPAAADGHAKVPLGKERIGSRAVSRPVAASSGLAWQPGKGLLCKVMKLSGRHWQPRKAMELARRERPAASCHGQDWLASSVMESAGSPRGSPPIARPWCGSQGRPARG